MRKISVFNFMSVDGFFAGPKGEIDWFKDVPNDPEYGAWRDAQAGSGGALMFGRTTYEMMKSFWPTDAAAKMDAKMANVMNNMEKIVFSKTVDNNQEGPNWKNIKVFHDIDPNVIQSLKEEEGGDITILGSGSIIQQLTNLGAIDEYCFLVVPVILGKGKSMFTDVKQTTLELLEEKTFKNGLVVLRYAS